jgi:hypothetical protein
LLQDAEEVDVLMQVLYAFFNGSSDLYSQTLLNLSLVYVGFRWSWDCLL